MILLTKKYYKKIAVFDLDGTLYRDNSHIEILCDYYNTNFFKSIIFKMIGKVYSRGQLHLMYYLYNKIPRRYRDNFIPEFSPIIVKKLNEKIKNGFFPLIMSSAPKELLNTASRCLNIGGIKCARADKHNVLTEKYRYDYLFVCTDNKSDIQLLELADEAVITAVPKHREYFRKKLKEGKYIFIDI